MMLDENDCSDDNNGMILSSSCHDFRDVPEAEA